MAPTKTNYDVIIIGAGIVGSMMARFLSKYELDILLIDKNSDIGMETSAANSAIIHSGNNPIPGTMKSKMNIAANPMWDQLAEELQIGFKRCGDFVVATSQEELDDLQPLLERGLKNGVPGLTIVGPEVVRARVPEVADTVVGALWAPTAGVVDPFGAVVAAAENAVMNGTTVKLNTKFEEFLTEGNKVVGIKTNQGEFNARWVINAAGLYADEVMHKLGIRPEFKITPRKGEYYVLDGAEFQIDTVIFPVPSKISKGIVVGTTTHGNAFLGPTAEEIDDKSDKAVTLSGLEEVWEGTKKLIPTLNKKFTVANFAGLRAGGNAPCEDPNIDYNKDFIIEIPEEVEGFVNLGGIESPGFTSAPAIAVYVIELMEKAGEKFVEKKDWNPIRPARPNFASMTHEERQTLIAQNPAYGRVICRCENVTEGEIIDAIHAPIPALTYDAIKRRTWLGTGRCLGGFDMPRVVDILTRETGLSHLEVSKKGEGSEFLSRRSKIVINEG